MTLSGPTAETIDRHPRTILFELEKKLMHWNLSWEDIVKGFVPRLQGMAIEELEKKLRRNSALVDMFVYGTEGEKELLAGDRD